MKKKELLSLPEIKITKEIIETARKDKPKVEKCYGNHKRYIYTFKEYYRAKVFNGILKVAIFARDDVIRERPSYEIYLSKEEKRYLTYDTINESWRTAKIDNLSNTYSYYEEKRYYCRGAEKAIVDYLDNEKKTGFEAIFYFQSEIKKEGLRIAHKRITDRIDSKMELVPALPKGFDKWIENVAMVHSRYIYYMYSKKVKEGYCTHCKAMVPITSPKHNTAGKCTRCKSEITYKAVKKAAVVRDEGYASIFQKTKEGFIFRYFEIVKKYRDYLNPEMYTLEAIRIMFDKNLKIIGEYEWAEFKNTGVIRWIIREQKTWSYSYYQSNTRYMQASTLYNRNLNKVFKDTEYQYSAIDLLAKGLKGERFCPDTYLKEYKQHKFLEYIVKLKLYQIVKGYLRGYDCYLNESGQRIHEVLKVSKEQVKQLSEMNATYTELRVLQIANKAGVRLTSAQLRWTTENIGMSELIKFMRYSTGHKVIKYLKKQSASEDIKIMDLGRDYCDYLETAEKLEYDLNNSFIFFPKRLKQSHDLVVEEWKEKKEHIEAMEDDERDKVMEEIAEELVKNYSMKDKHFSIRIPWSCGEIRNEGHTLHHCVGGYVKRVLTKETTILFVRKNEEIDQPYYTLEIKHNNVAQLRGKNNCSPTPEVQAFVDKFKRKKLQEKFEKEAV